MQKDNQYGTLYGVGVGPGDPGLITVRAVEVLGRAGCIAAPVTSDGAESRALLIAASAVSLEGIEILKLVLPMTRDEQRLEAARLSAARRLVEKLSAGIDVAFVTVGDPLFYSTFSHVAARVSSVMPDARVEVVPGVTSVAAAAALSRVALAEADERVAIVPAVYGPGEISRNLRDFDTLVLLKVNTVMDDVIEAIEQAGLIDRAVFVSRAGWPDEEVVTDIRTLRGSEIDYFSMVLVRK